MGKMAVTLFSTDCGREGERGEREGRRERREGGTEGERRGGGREEGERKGGRDRVRGERVRGEGGKRSNEV